MNWNKRRYLNNYTDYCITLNYGIKGAGSEEMRYPNLYYVFHKFKERNPYLYTKLPFHLKELAEISHRAEIPTIFQFWDEIDQIQVDALSEHEKEELSLLLLALRNMFPLAYEDAQFCSEIQRLFLFDSAEFLGVTRTNSSLSTPPLSCKAPPPTRSSFFSSQMGSADPIEESLLGSSSSPVSPRR